MLRKLLLPTFIFLLLSGFFLIVRNQIVDSSSDILSKTVRQKNGPAADFDKAVAEEYELLKDPSIGKIPLGIRERELGQANDILTRQLQDGPQNRTAATTYAFQGPSNLGGRVRALAFDVADGSGNTIIAGSVSGGIFRTTNGGAGWTRQNPNDQLFSVTALAQDTRPGFRNIWYYAGGEALGNSASESGALYAGHGVYKSVDNGLSWTRLPNSNTGALFAFDRCADLISRLIVNPVNGDVYAARLAGIIRSVDQGATWVTVLGTGGCNTGMVGDIVSTSTGRLYAGLAGSVGSSFDGVWTSTDGTTWSHIAGTGAATTPATWKAVNTYGRIVLAVAPSNENLVYALYHNNLTSNCAGTPAPEAELFVWDLATNLWNDLSATLPNEGGCSNGNDPFAVQGGYDLEISVKPNDPNTIFIGGTNAYRSIDAGATWTRIGGYANTAGYTRYANHHPDVHVLKFGPASNDILFSGDDGGIQKADITVTPASWTSLNNNFPTYQYYHVAIKQESGVNDFIGGAQDNGTTGVVGGGTAFSELLGADGVAVGLANGPAPYQQFCGFQNGTIFRRANNLSNGFINAVLTPAGLNTTYTSIFTTYFHLDPDNTENLYYACELTAGNSNRIQRNTNATTSSSSSWTIMDFAYDGYVRSMATTRGAYTPASRLYLGTSGGKVYRMTDPANAPTSEVPSDITPPGMTGARTVIGLAVNPTNHNELLAVYSNYGVTNIWYTNNAGDAAPTWVNAEGNLTLPSVRSAMIIQNGASTEYYVGTSVGLYKSLSMAGFISWTQEAASELGNVPVTGLSLRPADNVFAIGTHGLGMWRGVSSAPLPVTLVNFKGVLQNKKAALTWTTENEMNNKGFEVQRSYDGNQYKTIGFVAGAINSTSSKSYNFIDEELAQQVNYYRLKQIDLDGVSKLSNIVNLRNPFNDDIKVLSNPFNSYLDLQLGIAFQSRANLRLLDVSGKVVYQTVLQPNQARLRLPLSNVAIARGIYTLQITAGVNQYNTKLVKQ